MFGVLGNLIVYWILRFITFFSLFFCGYLVSNKDENGRRFWKFSLPALIVYSLNYGLRWDRSFDYPHYYSDLTSNTLWTDYDEPLYLAWIEFFKWTELPYWVAFIFYSAILMYGFMLIVKKYPKTAIWAYPLFLVLPSNVDNFVRQYFATAFFFIGIYFFHNKEIKKTVLFFASAVMIHTSALFAIACVSMFRYVNLCKIITKPWMLVFLYLVLYMFWDVSLLGPVGDFLMTFNAGETTLNNYLENADTWFTAEGDINDKLGVAGVGSFSAVSDFIHMLISVGVIFWGYSIAAADVNKRIIYWSAVAALFIRLIGGSVEIYSRFVCWLIVFEPILIGLLFSDGKMRKITKYTMLTFVVFYYYGIQFVWQITKLSLTGYAFVWDK